MQRLSHVTHESGRGTQRREITQAQTCTSTLTRRNQCNESRASRIKTHQRSLQNPEAFVGHRSSRVLPTDKVMPQGTWSHWRSSRDRVHAIACPQRSRRRHASLSPSSSARFCQNEPPTRRSHSGGAIAKPRPDSTIPTATLRALLSKGPAGPVLGSRAGRLPVGPTRHDRRDVRDALGGSCWYGGSVARSRHPLRLPAGSRAY